MPVPKAWGTSRKRQQIGDPASKPWWLLEAALSDYLEQQALPDTPVTLKADQSIHDQLRVVHVPRSATAAIPDRRPGWVYHWHALVILQELDRDRMGAIGEWGLGNQGAAEEEERRPGWWLAALFGIHLLLSHMQDEEFAAQAVRNHRWSEQS